MKLTFDTVPIFVLYIIMICKNQIIYIFDSKETKKKKL